MTSAAPWFGDALAGGDGTGDPINPLDVGEVFEDPTAMPRVNLPYRGPDVVPAVPVPLATPPARTRVFPAARSTAGPPAPARGGVRPSPGAWSPPGATAGRTTFGTAPGRSGPPQLAPPLHSRPPSTIRLPAAVSGAFPARWAPPGPLGRYPAATPNAMPQAGRGSYPAAPPNAMPQAGRGSYPAAPPNALSPARGGPYPGPRAPGTPGLLDTVRAQARQRRPSPAANPPASSWRTTVLGILAVLLIVGFSTGLAERLISVITQLLQRH